MRPFKVSGQWTPLLVCLLVLSLFAGCTKANFELAAIEPNAVQEVDLNDEIEQIEEKFREFSMLHQRGEVGTPWFGDPARVDALKARLYGSSENPDHLALDIYAELRMAESLGWQGLNLPQGREVDRLRWEPERVDYDPYSDLLTMLSTLAIRERSVVATETLLYYVVDGYYFDMHTLKLAEIMKRQPGLISEAMLSSNFLHQLLAEGRFTPPAWRYNPFAIPHKSDKSHYQNSFGLEIISQFEFLGDSLSKDARELFLSALPPEIQSESGSIMLSYWEWFKSELESVQDVDEG